MHSTSRWALVIAAGAALWALDLGRPAVSHAASGIPIAVTPERDGSEGMVSDGSEGVYISWLRETSPSIAPCSLYVTRLTASGDRAWGSDLLVSDNVSPVWAIAYASTIVSDGSGGAILVWRDPTGGLLAQRVDRSGHAVWSVPVILDPAPTRYPPSVTSDGLGGVIVGWYDDRVGERAYVQRVRHDGSLAWRPAGVMLSEATGLQRLEGKGLVLSDGTGGAIAMFVQIGLAEGTAQIRLQHVANTGALLWGGAGVPLPSASTNHQFGMLIPSVRGAVIAAWSEVRPGTTIQNPDLDLFAMKFQADGTPAWSGSSVVCNANQSQRAVAGTPDGAGGAFLTWMDFRTPRPSSFALPHVFAQHLGADGTSQWTPNGVHMGGAISGGFEGDPAMVSDGSGGFWLTWDEADVLAGGMLDIRAGHYLASGLPAAGTPPGGIVVCDAEGDQNAPDIAPMGRSGVIVDWFDDRAAGALDGDLYAWICARGKPSPVLQPVEPVVEVEPALLRVTLGPRQGSLAIAFRVPRAEPVTVVVRDVQGRTLGRVTTEASAGLNTVLLDAVGARSGIYFTTLQAGGRTLVHKAAIVR
jgi:hypothetical protein